MSSSSLLKILLASLFSAVSLCGHSQNVVTLVHDDVYDCGTVTIARRTMPSACACLPGGRDAW